MHPSLCRALSFFACLLLAESAHAEEKLLFKSPEQQVKVLELYTSEGCSSCPPAERWFSSLSSHPALWRTFLPLQFHVDYWDGLGWPDIFAKSEFSLRQKTYAREWQGGSIYTPGFVLMGKESQKPGSGELSSLGEEKVGVLEVWKTDLDSYRVVFTPVRDTARNLTATLALLGSGIQKEVEAGENANETLQHDFLVLETEEKAMEKRGESYEARLQLPISKNAVLAKSRSLAVWVNRRSSITPLQATGGPIL